MPVILKPADYEGWLGAANEVKAREMIRPYPGEEMTARRVGQYVNNVRNEGPACIQPLDQDSDAAGEREPKLL
jgi:putative SOS response-associated peptidase YedK